MARVFITGSADGLGLLAAELLLGQGHEVVLHARSAARARDARTANPRAAAVLVGDLASIADVRTLADDANALGGFDAIIHNAGVGYREPRKITTPDGLSHIFAINVLAPYLLTCLMTRPKRLVYLTSGLQRSGDSDMSDLQWAKRRWNGTQAYSDSKLFDVVLAFAVARRWAGVFSNAVEPGWVATKMGGAGAPDDLSLGAVTQAWLAASDDAAARVSGQNFYHQLPRETPASARSTSVQDELLRRCSEITGVVLPAP
jgi:NAD(P)-dependent dehydrogenase (short-subunit alcohol dehydrogenase family)